MGVWCAKFQLESLFNHQSSHQTEARVTLFLLPQIQQREEVELLERCLRSSLTPSTQGTARFSRRYPEAEKNNNNTLFFASHVLNFTYTCLCDLVVHQQLLGKIPAEYSSATTLTSEEVFVHRLFPLFALTWYLNPRDTDMPWIMLFSLNTDLCVVCGFKTISALGRCLLKSR